MKVTYEKVEKDNFERLAKLAQRLWHCAFDGLIGEKQVEYMLDKFQSEKAFERQTQEEGYAYYFVCEDGNRAGYVAIANRDDRLFLSKLYLAPEAQGKGMAVKTLEFVKDEAKQRGKLAVYLTVNKGNARAIAVYEKFGFKRIDAVVTDIGGGFVMDDYIYELAL